MQFCSIKSVSKAILCLHKVYSFLVRSLALFHRSTISVSLAFSLAACSAPLKDVALNESETLLVVGNILTMNAEQPVASSMLIHEGRIVGISEPDGSFILTG